MKKFLLAAAALVIASGTALAGQCPVDMKKIDAALAAGSSLGASQLAKVMELRAAGEKKHKSGQHGESMATLAQAKTMLGIE